MSDPGTIADRLPPAPAPAPRAERIDVTAEMLEGGPGMRDVALSDPTFSEYRKRTTVLARRMTEEFHVRTLEGDVTGKPGDFLAVGIEGEMYPIAASVFEATYEPIDHGDVATETLADVQATAENLVLVYVPEQHRIHSTPIEECNTDSSSGKRKLREEDLSKVSPDVSLCEHCVSPVEARIIRAGLRRQ